jgi:excisionase family DNA binding protein
MQAVYDKVRAVSREEARHRLGDISMGTLDGLLRTGKLRSIRVGQRRVVIPVAALEEFLKAE